jgi:hypothetical protein
VITARRAARAVRAALPGWLMVTFAACAVIPGPFDELAVIVAVLIVCAIQPVRIARARSAWRGGKSHRASGS